MGNKRLMAVLVGAALAGLASSDPFGGGYSNADRERDAEKRRAKAERETWDQPEGESRQVRRARERQVMKRGHQ